MAIGKQAVGERIYVFSTNGGLQVQNKCVIDCHGEQKLFGNGFALANGKKLVFYVEQGRPLAFHSGVHRFEEGDGNDYNYTNSLKAIATGVAVAAETFVGPRVNCPDYNLTKIQKTNAGCLGGAGSNFIGDRNEVTYESLKEFLKHHAGSMDIVTIRNRGMKLDVTLSEVIQDLTGHGYGYSEFHCCFCRSAQLPVVHTSLPPRQVTGAARPRGGTY
jgi:hypothetical protein